MQFTQIPQHYSPLGDALLYTVKHTAAADIEVRVIDPSDSSVLAAKRFASVAEASFDIAPALRRGLRFEPRQGGTGFVDSAGRCATAQVKAFLSDDEAVVATSSSRVFLPGDSPASSPSLLTTMPRERLIPEGACDELTIFSEAAFAVTVTAVGPDSTSAQHYRSSNSGLQPFRLDTRDFPGAETITVDAGVCGQVVYTLVPAREEAVRLAWRSHVGSIEHYSFPVVRETTLRVDKTRGYGADGPVVTAWLSEQETHLVSAYESTSVLEALAGVIAAPEVWLIEEEGYTPVDITTDEATILRHGAMCCLEIAFRSTRKTSASWN